MPWIEAEDCNGCGICVEECPAYGISLQDERATIDMNECIYCGTCHNVCPQDAVRHDSERIPEEVTANLEWVKGLLRHYTTTEQREAFIKRMKRHFTKERAVMQETLGKLDSLPI